MKTNSKVLFATVFLIAFTVSGLWLWKGRAACDHCRYRFPVTRQAVINNVIPDLEKRTARPAPSSFDLAELANEYFQRARLTGDFTDFDRAEATAEKSLKILPQPNASKMVLAQVADAKHDFTRAIELANEVLEEKGSVGALSVLISSNLATGDLQEASKYADQAVNVRAGLGTYLMRSLVLLAQGRDEEADYDLARAVKVEDMGDPEESARLRSLWARHLIKRGEMRKASVLLDESLRILPGNHLALSLRGEMEIRLGKYAAAQKSLMEAFTASKQMRYLIYYSRAKLLAGDEVGAKEYRDQAERLIRNELTSKSYGHRLDLAEILLDKNRPETINEAIELAAEESKNRRNSETLAVLAKGLLAANRSREAQTAIEEVLRSGVRDADYYLLASKIELAMQNLARAELFSDLARKYNPTAPQPKLKVASAANVDYH